MKLSKNDKQADSFWPALGGSEIQHEGHTDVYQGHDTKDKSKLYECPKGSGKYRWEKSAKSKKAFEGDDKWQSQKEVVPIGLGERAWQAYEPYKKADTGDEHSSTMAMYWDTVKDLFFEKMNNWSGIRNELKKMYSEITDEDLEELFGQVQYYLDQYKQQKESNGDENYGFFDGPKDLGKNPSGDFPSVSWMPRGQEDMDVSPNASQAKKAQEEILTHDQESQIAAAYGPEYNTALMHYNDAIKNGHAPDRALEYAIRELDKVDVVIDSSKLTEVVDTYLEVPK